MKIFASIETGFYRALKSWKGVFIVWLLLLILVVMITFPVKGSLKTAFGDSMITQKLSGGIDPEVFTDLGLTLRTIFSSMTTGLFLIIILLFFLNAFLSGGLFNALKRDTRHFSISEFFRSGSRNFWSFFMISLIISLVIVFLTVGVILLAAVIVQSIESADEKTIFIVGSSGAFLLLVLLPVFLLAADYSRARRAYDEKITSFRALGYGFSTTFRKFWSSYALMLIMLIFQVLFGYLFYKIFAGWFPDTRGKIILLLVSSQFAVYVRLIIKTWRYGSVTALMEDDLFKAEIL